MPVARFPVWGGARAFRGGHNAILHNSVLFINLNDIVGVVIDYILVLAELKI